MGIGVPLMPVLKDGARLLTRQAQLAFALIEDWDEKVVLHDGIKLDMEF